MTMSGRPGVTNRTNLRSAAGVNHQCSNWQKLCQFKFGVRIPEDSIAAPRSARPISNSAVLLSMPLETSLEPHRPTQKASW